MKKIIIFLVLVVLIILTIYPKEYSFGAHPLVKNLQCFGKTKIVTIMIGRTDAICYGILIK